MLRSLSLIILTAISLHAMPIDTPKALIKELDNALDSSIVYSQQKQARITQLRANAFSVRNGDVGERLEANDALFNEYKSYRCDSAAYYLIENINIATGSNEQQEAAMKNRISLSYLLSSSGYFLPAVDMLQTVNPKELPSKLLPTYYEAYEKAFSEMSNFEVATPPLNYSDMAIAYQDSLLRLLPSDDELRMQFEETRLREQKRFTEALAVNDKRLAEVSEQTPLYALIMFQRSLIYQSNGDKEQEMIALAKSAITDVRLGTKDHASLWMLAKIIYDYGDIDRAYRYMKFSWEDTKFFNAPLRNWQSAGILSLIEERYSNEIQLRNTQLKVFFSIISVLFLLLLAAMIFIKKQNNRLTFSNEELSKAHDVVKETNSKLKKLNGDLAKLNDELKNANSALLESNNIKEVYFSRFIKLCSEYIDKLDRFRSTVSNKLATGQIQELKKMIQSKHFIDDEVKEFYKNFDSAFLHIFPDFVAKFNDLLVDDGKVELKDEELLNPELRIFALIRLGFNDSSQIAEFLRYSVNTIYNYRAKVKNKARVNRDEFENLVKKIH